MTTVIGEVPAVKKKQRIKKLIPSSKAERAKTLFIMTQLLGLLSKQNESDGVLSWRKVEELLMGMSVLVSSCFTSDFFEVAHVEDLENKTSTEVVMYLVYMVLSSGFLNDVHKTTRGMKQAGIRVRSQTQQIKSLLNLLRKVVIRERREAKSV